MDAQFEKPVHCNADHDKEGALWKDTSCFTQHESNLIIFIFLKVIL